MNRSIDKTHDTVSKGKTHDQLKRSVQSVREFQRFAKFQSLRGIPKTFAK